MKRALLTGCGSDGIGRAIALTLAQRGWEVIASCRTDEQVRTAEGSADGAPVTWIKLDLNSDGDIAGLASRLPPGPLDLVVNCAVHARREPSLADLRRDALLEAMSVNVYGVFALARVLSPSLRASAAPWFVAIGSSMGTFADRSPGGGYSYRTSKAAAHFAIHLLAAEPMLAGIGMATLHPGWVRTKLGGPDAPLAPAKAATDIADLLERLGPDEHGGLFDRFGKRLPW